MGINNNNIVTAYVTEPDDSLYVKKMYVCMYIHCTYLVCKILPK